MQNGHIPSKFEYQARIHKSATRVDNAMKKRNEYIYNFKN